MNNLIENSGVFGSGANQPSGSPPQKLVVIPPAPQVNLDNVTDFSNVCRICATVTELVVPIFSGEGLQNNLADKIHEHLPIKVARSDVLPQVVCYQCASTLLAWHELVKCSVQADQAMRTKLNVENRNNNARPRRAVPPNPNVDGDHGNQVRYITEYIVTSNPSRLLGPRRHQGPVIALSSIRIPVPEPVPVRANRNPIMELCHYCDTLHPDEEFNEHIIQEHSHYIFLCEECDCYIDKRDFMRHMCGHAAEYDLRRKQQEEAKKLREEQEKLKREQEKSKQEQEKVKEEQGKDKEEQGKVEEEQGKDKEEPETKKMKVSDENQTTSETAPTKTQDTEFSDHSDAEGFQPLPDAVIKAMEDSQDTPTTENNGDSDKIDSAKNKLAKKPLKKSRTCPICSKVFRASSSFFYHMKYTHKRVKEHECEICAKKFGTRACLTTHLATHSGECQFECKECKKRFKSKASLYIHEQTHTGVKTWSCTQCDMSFRWKTHLKRHMKRHTSEKTHVCETCGRGFNVRCDLLRHARTHEAGKFACEECDIKFAQQRYLKVHMDRKHPTKVGNRSK